MQKLSNGRSPQPRMPRPPALPSGSRPIVVPRGSVAAPKGASAPPPTSVTRLAQPPPARPVSVEPPASPKTMPSLPSIVPPPKAPADALADRRAEVVTSEALAPILRTLEAMQLRIASLEKELEAVRAPVAPVVALERQPLPAAPAPVVARAVVVPPPPATVAISIPVPIDVFVDDRELAPFDGRRRRRNALAALAFFVLLALGGLLGSMALSYR